MKTYEASLQCSLLVVFEVVWPWKHEVMRVEAKQSPLMTHAALLWMLTVQIWTSLDSHACLCLQLPLLQQTRCSHATLFQRLVTQK